MRAQVRPDKRELNRPNFHRLRQAHVDFADFLMYFGNSKEIFSSPAAVKGQFPVGGRAAPTKNYEAIVVARRNGCRRCERMFDASQRMISMQPRGLQVAGCCFSSARIERSFGQKAGRTHYHKPTFRGKQDIGIPFAPETCLARKRYGRQGSDSVFQKVRQIQSNSNKSKNELGASA